MLESGGFMNANKELRKKQSEMHANYFDRAKDAIDSGYYLEAMFLEYAAIEGRLEVILGRLGLPCSMELQPELRNKINISTRISCLNKIREKNLLIFNNTKLEKEFFFDWRDEGLLAMWIKDRNTYVHGLYKDAIKYEERNDLSKEIARRGYSLTDSLFAEASRLGRLLRSNPDLFTYRCGNCGTKRCVASTK